MYNTLHSPLTVVIIYVFLTCKLSFTRQSITNGNKIHKITPLSHVISDSYFLKVQIQINAK